MGARANGIVVRLKFEKEGRWVDLGLREIRNAPSCGAWRARLRLVAQPLLVAVFFHALAAFVFRDFRFSLLFNGTHGFFGTAVETSELVDDFVEWILDDPFRTENFQARDHLADDFLFDHRFDGDPSGLGQRRNGRIPESGQCLKQFFQIRLGKIHFEADEIASGEGSAEQKRNALDLAALPFVVPSGVVGVERGVGLHQRVHDAELIRAER